MKERLTHLMMYLYPRRWRDRYGEEFEELLVDEGSSMRTLLNVGWAGLKEHFVPTQELIGGECSLSFGAIVKKPSALIPMAMSLAALGVVLVHIAIAGIAPQGDEGAAAHMWQLLMAAQIAPASFLRDQMAAQGAQAGTIRSGVAGYGVGSIHGAGISAQVVVPEIDYAIGQKSGQSGDSDRPMRDCRSRDSTGCRVGRKSSGHNTAGADWAVCGRACDLRLARFQPAGAYGTAHGHPA